MTIPTPQATHAGPVARRPIDWLFLGALLSGCYQLLAPKSFGFGAGWEMVAVAENLARTGAFANPFQVMPTGPTAWVPPLYPLFLAALIKIFGGFYSVAAVYVNIVSNAVMAALLPYLSKVLFGTRIPGIFAAALAIVSYLIVPNWDVALTTPGIVLFCAASHRVWLRTTSPWRRGMVAGGFLGILLLLNPSALMVCVLWLGFLLLRLPAGGRRVRIAIVTICVAAVLVLPWMLRNRRVLGVFAMKANFGMVLYASSHECSGASVVANLERGCDDLLNPNKSAAEAKRIVEIGEPAYDRERFRIAVDTIRAHPARYARLTALRILQFWFPVPVRPVFFGYMVWVATVLSFAGAWQAVRDRNPAVYFLAAVWALYPIVYYLVVSDGRYRHPILWTSLLAAGYATQRLLETTPRGRVWADRISRAV